MKSLVLAFSLIAFAASAYANDAKQKSSDASKPAMSQSNKPSSDKSAAAGASGDKSFDQMDKNKDGQISRAEWNAARGTGASGGTGKSGGSTGGSGGASTGSGKTGGATPSTGK